MKSPVLSPFISFALRECFKYPFQSWATVVSMILLTAFPASLLVLSQAMEKSSERILKAAPSLVIRKVAVTGWEPIPGEILANLATVPGVVESRGRLWGLVSSPFGTLTLVGEEGIEPGQCHLGPGFGPSVPEDLILNATHSVQVAGVVGDDKALTQALTVKVNPDDARTVLKIPPDCFTDVAVFFFHDEEADFAKHELMQKIPFQVHIDTKTEARTRLASNFAKRGGLGLLISIPTLLAFLFFIWSLSILAKNQAYDHSVMRTLGWTVTELMKIQFLRSLLLGLPSVGIGLGFACLAVYGPFSTWFSSFFMGWNNVGLRFHWDLVGIPFLQVGCFVLIPYLTIQMIPLFRGAGKDPSDLLERHLER